MALADIETRLIGSGNSRRVTSRDLLEVVQATIVGAGGAPTWTSITGKPATFTPTAHTHPISDVTSLQATLDAKADDADLTAHVAAADPHTGYQREMEKGAANGYASLGAGTKVPTAELGGAGADATKYLRGDQTWVVPTASVAITGASLSFTNGDTFKRFTIADAACTADSKIVGTITRASVTDANDPGWVFLHTVVSRGAGTFDLLVAVLDWNAPASASRPNETVTFNYVLSA